MLNRILEKRGLISVSDYVNPSAVSLHDPLLMKDMDRACYTINRHIAYNNLIYIYGDYDADGVSSTSLMVRLMQKLGANYMYKVPNREKDGYGLHFHIVDEAVIAGASLIITVDTGITAAEVVDYAHLFDISVVITDHHEPPDIIPYADAVVNPKRKDCNYPFKGLAGVGVAYKLASALLGYPPDDLLEYVALGTVADIMPLVDENRYMVKRGLEIMSYGGSIGFSCLKSTCGIDSVTSTDIGFKLGPMINAAGRLYDATLAVELLVSDDPSFCFSRSRELQRINKQRQDLVKTCVKQAKEIVIQQNLDSYKVLVVYHDEWKSGVVGLIASAMVETYNKPTIVMHKHGSIYKGSCRSYGDFDLHKALTKCSHHLEFFGGHKGAAGLGIKEDSIPNFIESIHNLAEYSPDASLHKPEVDIGICEINRDLLEEFSLMEPYGEGNRPPLLRLEGYLTDMRQIGKNGDHFSGVISDSDDPFTMGPSVEIIQFKAWNKYKEIKRGQRVEVLGYVGEGYNGVNIMVESMKPIIT